MSAIAEDVRIALSQASVEENILRLEGQLDRGLYLRVNKILEGLGAKWDRKAKGHRFDVPDLRERLEGVVSTGVFVDPQRTFNFFETPRAVVERMLHHLHFDKSDLGRMILEPSAGKGAIISATDDLLGGDNLFFAYEAMDQNRAVLAGMPNVQVLGSDFSGSAYNLAEQILEATGGANLDACLMNPPFGNQADLQHVNQAISVLQTVSNESDGGQVPLVAVMSQGVRFRTNARTQAFKDRLRGLEHEFEDLPEGSFRESGTDVRTTLLAVRVRP